MFSNLVEAGATMPGVLVSLMWAQEEAFMMATARPADWRGNTQSDVGLLRPLRAAVVGTESVAGEQGVGDCTKNDSAVHAGRKPCGGWDSSFHQPDQAGVFADQCRNGVAKRGRLAFAGDRVDGIKGAFAIGHVTGAERRFGLTMVAVLASALTTARRRRRAWVLERG